jgi:hypothetical protein
MKHDPCTTLHRVLEDEEELYDCGTIPCSTILAQHCIVLEDEEELYDCGTIPCSTILAQHCIEF